jgi:hypothetical protein
MLLDDLVDGYVDQRERARAGRRRVRALVLRSGPERARLFAAYSATLDQEQKTAAAYAEAVTDVERWLQRSDARPARRAATSASRRWRL